MSERLLVVREETVRVVAVAQQGPPGAQGPTGATGATGPAGPTGPSGASAALPPVAGSFTAAGSSYFVVHEAMRLVQPYEAGTGTIAYARALASSPATFGAEGFPFDLLPGDVLRMTASGVSGFKAATLPRQQLPGLTTPVTSEYRLLEGSGQQAADSSGNALHGTLGTTAGADTSDPAWIAGGGLSFDGVDDRIILPVGAAGSTGAATFFVVAELTAAGSNPYLFGSNPVDLGLVAFFSGTTQQYRVAAIGSGGASAGATSASATPLNTKRVFVVRYNPGVALEGWENLTRVINVTASVPGARGNSAPVVGHYGGATGAFPGRVYRVVTYGRALSDIEVATTTRALAAATGAVL